MLNIWDDKKQNLYDQIADNIDWKVDDSQSAGVVLTMRLSSILLSNGKKVDFPELSFTYKDIDHYYANREGHYSSAASFYTLVAFDEDVILDFAEDTGFLRVQRVLFLPTSSSRAVPFVRLWRFRLSNKKLSFVKGRVDGFYERVRSRGTFESLKVSLY